MYKYNLQANQLFIYFMGEIDDCSASKMRENLDNLLIKNTNVKRVVFNFQNVTFMDSTGIGMLIGRYKKLKNYNVPISIQNPSQNVEKILEVSGLYGIMPKM